MNKSAEGDKDLHCKRIWTNYLIFRGSFFVVICSQAFKMATFNLEVQQQNLAI